MASTSDSTTGGAASNEPASNEPGPTQSTSEDTGGKSSKKPSVVSRILSKAKGILKPTKASASASESEPVADEPEPELPDIKFKGRINNYPIKAGPQTDKPKPEPATK